MSKIAELKVETQNQLKRKKFSTTTDFRIEMEKRAKRNFKMTNCNKTENSLDFTNHNGLRVEMDRFLAQE